MWVLWVVKDYFVWLMRKIYGLDWNYTIQKLKIYGPIVIFKDLLFYHKIDSKRDGVKMDGSVWGKWPIKYINGHSKVDD